MQSTPETIDLSSERDLPLRPVTIVEEVATMLVESSLVLKRKQKGQNLSPSTPQKRQTRTSIKVQGEGTTQMGSSSSRFVEFAVRTCVSVKDNPG